MAFDKRFQNTTWTARQTNSKMDAADHLYDPPPPNHPGKRGPKPEKGKKQRSLLERSQDDSIVRTSIDIVWYDGIKRTSEYFSGTSLWHKVGNDPVLVKWVVVRDPKGELRTEPFFRTDPEAEIRQILR
ncbi:hypothetical protein QUF75_10155 [Desulfococcaceae bacterium HSG7]|nr:hypothetical protein [Desulfococcaceae bacterium HSG7]